MDSSTDQKSWPKRLAVAGTLGSLLLLCPAIYNFLTNNHLFQSSYQSLTMLSFSLAIIGFITGLEIHLSRPFRNIFITANAGGILVTTCTITSGLLLIGLSILLITPIQY
jgi:NhaP-type Na+/H+ or K+/H+ antiporter